MYANKIIDTFTFFTIEEHVKKLQAGFLTIESSYSLRLPIRLSRIVVYGLTTKLRDVQFSSSITAAGPFPLLDGIPFFKPPFFTFKMGLPVTVFSKFL